MKNLFKKVSAVVVTAVALVGSAHANTDVSAIAQNVDLSSASAGIIAVGVALGGVVVTGIAVRAIIGMMKRI